MSEVKASFPSWCCRLHWCSDYRTCLSSSIRYL